MQLHIFPKFLSLSSLSLPCCFLHSVPLSQQQLLIAFSPTNAAIDWHLNALWPIKTTLVFSFLGSILRVRYIWGRLIFRKLISWCIAYISENPSWRQWPSHGQWWRWRLHGLTMMKVARCLKTNSLLSEPSLSSRPGAQIGWHTIAHCTPCHCTPLHTAHQVTAHCTLHTAHCTPYHCTAIPICSE